MFEFLNTTGLRKWIPQMIEEAKREMVIIVPFIKTSKNVYESLLEADKRGVETLMVYREESLKPEEKKKLLAISNLNLLHHPNVHAKCYMNESHLLITSMNLYEYSELNNREMGILIDKSIYEYSSDSPIDAAIEEIKKIINSSTLEKESWETKELGFEIDIIKDRRGRAEDYCRKLSKVFIHKRFEVLEHQNGNYGHICKNYSDNIDIIYEHRIEIDIIDSNEIIRNIYYSIPRGEYSYEGFKFYWNSLKSGIYLYADSNHEMWSNISEEEDKMRLMRSGVDIVIEEIKKVK